MRVAIIGSGITGLAAARALAPRHDIVIFEAAQRAGGHVYTVDTPDGRADMGFIVHNRDNYPRFCAMLDELGVATRPTAMSFSVAHDGVEWGSATLADVFAQRRRLLDLRHWRFIGEVLALLRRARRDFAELGAAGHSARLGGAGLGVRDRHGLADASLDDYLARCRVSRDVRERFVVPLAAALWSLAPDQCGAFPAVSYFGFLGQHGMLSPLRPLAWRTIVGGSKTYVDALLSRLGQQGVELRLGARVERIERTSGSVAVDGERFDRAIVATHADTALALLAEPTDGERRVLGAFRYSVNRTVLHTDRRFLPARVHAAWNYVADPDTSRVAVTYSMTKLQGLPDAPYLVTLNPRTEPRGVLHEMTFAHPQFDRAALAAQREVPRLPGPVAFAGAHLGFGFHEDGMRAGEQAAARIEADIRASGMNVRSSAMVAEAE